MNSLGLRSVLAGMATLAVTCFASFAQGQDHCPHCRGSHGHQLHTVYHHHDQYGYGSHHDYSHHGVLGEAGANWGDCVHRYYGDHDLFYNYYVGNNCGGYGAAMYLSPRPVPPHVGHTFITYQPLMPHEFMYKHHRTYHRYYDGGMGLTRTSVRYR